MCQKHFRYISKNNAPFRKLWATLVGNGDKLRNQYFMGYQDLASVCHQSGSEFTENFWLKPLMWTDLSWIPVNYFDLKGSQNPKKWRFRNLTNIKLISYLIDISLRLRGVAIYRSWWYDLSELLTIYRKMNNPNQFKSD